VPRLTSERFDLVLMDCQMPVMDGYEATRTTRQNELVQGKGAHVPIVAMTANAMPGDREGCLAAGMDDYLSKPFKREGLGAILARWLTGDASRATMQRKQVASPEPLADTDMTLNLEMLGQLREMFEGDLSGVLQAYLVDAQGQIGAMANAIERDSCVELGRAAHSLKSTSRSVGAEGVANLAAELETLARNEGCSARAVPTLQRLRERFVSAEAALTAEMRVRERTPAALSTSR
jgi:two-component system sensor histidine kinase/response regulator